MSQIDPGSLPPAVPMPVQSLPYSMASRSGRPGLITAIAILCIVIGCLSGLMSFILGMEGFGIYIASRFSRMGTGRATAYSTSVTAGSATTASLPPADTAVATNELAKQMSLSGGYVRELNKMFRSHGREVLGVDEDTPVTAASVRAAVTETGPPGPGGEPAHFVTSAGRVDIYPDHTVFTSSDGSMTIDTSVAKGTESTSQPGASAAASTAPSTMLTPAQINQALSAIQTTYGVKLNAKQVATVRSVLGAPNQQLITPGNATTVWSATSQPNGNVMVQFDSGFLTLGPQGQVVMQTSTALGTGPTFNVSGSTFGMVAGEAAASVALAIYIFILGILLFRTSARMPRLLRIYAMLKIPLALLAAAALPLFFYQFTSGMSGFIGAATISTPFVIWGAVLAVIGCAFPIGLLIALRSRTARDYFNSVATG